MQHKIPPTPPLKKGGAGGIFPAGAGFAGDVAIMRDHVENWPPECTLSPELGDRERVREI